VEQKHFNVEKLQQSKQRPTPGPIVAVILSNFERLWAISAKTVQKSLIFQAILGDFGRFWAISGDFGRF